MPVSIPKLLGSLGLIMVTGFGVKQILPLVDNVSYGREKDLPVPCQNDSALSFDDAMFELYSESGLDTLGASLAILRKGLLGYYNLRNESKLTKPVITLIDFSRPSHKERLWVVNVEDKEVLFHSLVAHGRGSGDDTTSQVSNLPESHMSSQGFYVTSTSYMGFHGLSLNIDGQEAGYNDNARDRSIVVHAADYVDPKMIEKAGRIGRSHGCPALPSALCNEVICVICDKSALFIYFPSEAYEKESRYLKSATAYKEFAEENQVMCFTPPKAVAMR